MEEGSGVDLGGLGDSGDSDQASGVSAIGAGVGMAFAGGGLAMATSGPAGLAVAAGGLAVAGLGVAVGNSLGTAPNSGPDMTLNVGAFSSTALSASDFGVSGTGDTGAGALSSLPGGSLYTAQLVGTPWVGNGSDQWSGGGTGS